MSIHILTRLDAKAIPEGKDEVRVFSVVRDEARRIPYLLAYYRKLGVSRFFFVDNGSTDGTTALLLAQPDCHVFHTTDSYAEASVGMSWTMRLMDLYGEGRWCLVADADELLVYPRCETVRLPEFCSWLDAEGSEAVKMFMLDMYCDGPISGAVCEPGRDFREICPYFDKDYAPLERVALRRSKKLFPAQDMIGGPRARCFYGDQGVNSTARRLFVHFAETLPLKLRRLGLPVPQIHVKTPTLVKIPLIKWRRGYFYPASTHQIVPAVRASAVTAVFLHFKFFADFHDRAVKAVQGGQHSQGGVEYKRYVDRIGSVESFMYEGSTRYEDSAGLEKLGLIASCPAFEAFAARREAA